MKMIDFTKRLDFVQLILIIAVACLALGAITPAASAADYEDISFQFSGTGGEISGTINLGDHQPHVIPNAFFDGSNLDCQNHYLRTGGSLGGYPASLIQFIDNPGIYTDMGYTTVGDYYFYIYQVTVDGELTSSESDVYIRLIADFLLNNTDVPSTSLYYANNGYHASLGSTNVFLWVPGYTYQSFNYSYEPFYPGGESLDISIQSFAPDDPSGMYVLSLDGSLLDTTYTVGINRYTSEFKYLVDSYAYTDGSGTYTFTGSRSLTLPIFYNSFTNMPYSYEVSINLNDEDGYLKERYLVYWSDLGGLYDTVPEPLVPTPKPTVTFVPSVPVDPSDIIPDPNDLDNTVNITGWYQDQGYEGNNITAPIYSGLRGWFNENLIPVIDFFLVPTNYVASTITDSADTSTSGISYITEELGSYAAPFNMVGGYVVLLVPEVVWIVVFAALSIGYVVLLIKISTGSIRDTISRFLGGGK